MWRDILFLWCPKDWTVNKKAARENGAVLEGAHPPSRYFAVKKRTQLMNPLTKTSTKRNKEGGQFMAVKSRRRRSRAS